MECPHLNVEGVSLKIIENLKIAVKDGIQCSSKNFWQCRNYTIWRYCWHQKTHFFAEKVCFSNLPLLRLKCPFWRHFLQIFTSGNWIFQYENSDFFQSFSFGNEAGKAPNWKLSKCPFLQLFGKSHLKTFDVSSKKNIAVFWSSKFIKKKLFLKVVIQKSRFGFVRHVERSIVVDTSKLTDWHITKMSSSPPAPAIQSAWTVKNCLYFGTIFNPLRHTRVDCWGKRLWNTLDCIRFVPRP